MITCSADFVMDLDRDLNDVQYKPKNKKIMKEELITFETAKLAKEKGFNWEVKHYYKESFPNNLMEHKIYINFNKYAHLCVSVPTKSLLQKWLREVPKISIVIDDFITNEKIRYDHKVKILGSQDVDSCEEPYETYEEAREDALKIALRLKK